MAKGKVQLTVDADFKAVIEALKPRLEQAVRDALGINESVLRDQISAPFFLGFDRASRPDKTVSMRHRYIDEIDELDPLEDDPHFSSIGDLVRKRMDELKDAQMAALLRGYPTMLENQSLAEPVTFDKVSAIMKAAVLSMAPSSFGPFRYEPMPWGDAEKPDRMKTYLFSYPMFLPINPAPFVKLEIGDDYPALSFEWTIPDTPRAMRAVALYTRKPGDRRRRKRAIRILRAEIGRTS